MRIMLKTKKLDVKEYYNMDETKLKTVYREEDLGIIFDNKLSLEELSSRYVTEVFCTSRQGYVQTVIHVDNQTTLGIRSHNLESPLKETYSYDRKCAA